MNEMFEIWDKGEFFFNDTEKELMELPLGAKIGGILKGSTKCPVGNSTCEAMIFITIYGTNPEKGHKKEIVMLCSAGIEGDGERCPLNK